MNCAWLMRGWGHGDRQGEGQVQADDSERLISLQFAWGPETKEVSSIFIGTSPEFELALYTLCFVAGAEENIVTIAGYEVKIRCSFLPRLLLPGDCACDKKPYLLSVLLWCALHALACTWTFKGLEGS